MNKTERLLLDVKRMLLGVGLILLALAALAFGYVFFQNTSGAAVCVYGGLVLLVVGIFQLLEGWLPGREPAGAPQHNDPED
ncbi:MAG: hypothetical protein LKJ80_01935 [Oscillibacter sp.]|jgi:uncharacterized membrane protein HdeD (DUF308 family)|nr:hypothetical protein [Oscillibacter sp.]